MNELPLSGLITEKISQLCADCGDSLGSVRGLHKMVIRQAEKPLIENVLKAVGGNQIKAAQVLGVNRNTLRKRMKAYGLLNSRRWIFPE